METLEDLIDGEWLIVRRGARKGVRGQILEGSKHHDRDSGFYPKVERCP